MRRESGLRASNRCTEGRCQWVAVKLLLLGGGYREDGVLRESTGDIMDEGGD